MTDDRGLSKDQIEKLINQATALTRVEQFEDAVATFEAHLPRLSSGTDKDKRLAASAFSYYGLCIAALRKQYSDAMKYCQLSLKVQPKNPEHYENLAKVHLLARSRSRAVNALFQGLEQDPNHAGINKVLDNIGRRQEPVISFLPRNNALNIYLGKKRHEKFVKRRAAAKARRMEQLKKRGMPTGADSQIRAAHAKRRKDLKG